MWHIGNVDVAFAGTVAVWLLVSREIAKTGTAYTPRFGLLLLIGTPATFFVLLMVAASINRANLPFGPEVHNMILLAFLLAVWFQVNSFNTSCYRSGQLGMFGFTLLVMLVLFVFVAIRLVKLWVR